MGVDPPHAAKHAVENNYNAAKQRSYSTSIPSTSQQYEGIDNPRAAKHDGKNNCVTIQVNSSSIPPLVEKQEGGTCHVEKHGMNTLRAETSQGLDSEAVSRVETLVDNPGTRKSYLDPHGFEYRPL